MSKRYFVTGTDTEVGKTVASCALLQAARQQAIGRQAISRWPLAARRRRRGLRNSDALALQRNSSLQLDYATVNPYTFAEPTSPHIISAQEGRPIESLVMSAGLRALEQQADWVLVEGAGGWFTPLLNTFTFADWVTQEQLPVILVVGVKLGCINHAMLTAQAIQHAGLTLAGWVANDVTPPGKRHAEYMTTLTRMIPAPLLGEIPWLPENPENAATGQVHQPCLVVAILYLVKLRADRVFD